MTAGRQPFTSASGQRVQLAKSWKDCHLRPPLTKHRVSDQTVPQHWKHKGPVPLPSEQEHTQQTNVCFTIQKRRFGGESRDLIS